MAEHQRAVATLAESEARTRQIIEGAVDSFIAIDARGIITDWNPAAEIIFGWSRAEALDRNLSDMIIPPQMQVAHRSGMAHFLASGEGPVIGKRLELIARHRDGREFPVETTISAIRAGDSWRFTAFLHDITQRRKLETGVRRSESRYRALFESSRDAIMTLEPPSWKFTSGNAAAVAMFRTRDVEHFVALGPWELSPERQPDGRTSGEKAKEMIETAMRDGSLFFEWTHRRFNSESFPCTVLLSRMETDGTMFLQATVRDITERKQMGEAVAQLSRQVRVILDSAGEGILGLDLDGKHTFINPVAATMLGYEVKELTGKPSHSTWHHTLPDGRLYPQEDCPIYGAFKDGLVHHVDTEVFWRKDGTSFPVDYTSTPVRDEQGALQGAVVVFHDITEQKQSEDELREKERLLSDSQRHGHIGSWFYDLKGPFKWSKEMYRLYGVSPDTFTPTPESLLSLIHPEDRQAMQAWLTVCAAGAKHELVFRIKNPDGTIRFILGRGESFHDADSRLIHMAGTALDITELKRAEEALLAKNKELEQFTYAVSHDLRSPLVTIQTFHSHLEQDISAHDAANVAKDLDFIQTATGKMGRLLDELANLLRVGRQSNPQKDVPLHDVVQDEFPSRAYR
jgi:PAS domain S-box-containing protein